MSFFRLLHTLFFVTSFGFSALGNPGDPYFLQNYDNRNGLSNSSINHIFNDASHLLWVATWDGLNMYDGSTFHVFNYSKENDFKSIGSNVIQQIAEGRNGNIWVATIEGISRYEKQTGKFYNYFYYQSQRSRVSEQEYAITVDTSGAVYCLNQKTGLSWYDEKTDAFKNCNLPQQDAPISKIAFDEANRFWLIRGNGQVEVYSISHHQFTRLRAYQLKERITNFFMVNQTVFLTTARDRLMAIENINAEPREIIQISHPISSIIAYKGHYLVAWANKGYGVYDSHFEPADFLQAEAEKMKDIKITSLALGNEDILWFGTDGNGIIKVYPQTKSFGTVTLSENGLSYNKPIRAFCEVNGRLWVGTKGSGIAEIQNIWTDKNSSLGKKYFLAPEQLENNSVYSLKKGNDGLVYIGSDAHGVEIYDLKTNRFIKWADIEGYENYAEFGSVYAINQDVDNSLWLGTSGYGLIHLKINRNRNKLSLVFLERFVFNNSNAGPANDIIYALADGDQDHLWIGCRYGGLSVLDKKTLKFKNFKALTYEGSLSNNDVLSIFRDSRNMMWIGTSYGLNLIPASDASKEELLFKKLTTDNGLPNNTIHAIGEDGTGHIWISTNKGLAKVNQADLKVSYYQQLDGLQSNEFCDGAVWKDDSGTLFFGGTYGFNHFLPQDIGKSDWQPNLLLSGIVMGAKNIMQSGFTVLEKENEKPLSFSIGRDDNYFELDVKAISFLNAEKCEYAYFLEGYDKVWHYAGTNGKILYSNILPGRYTLKIKWSNGEGVWTNEKPALSVQVHQYFWLTGYAYGFYALLVMSFIYIFYRYRRNKLEIKHQLEVEHLLRTKEEEIHRNRMGFFTNIAHELQTPLTLIMGSAERFMEKKHHLKDQKDRPYFLSLIHQQASRLTYLIQQLLEFRKVEEGFYKNRFSFLNISELLQNLAEPFIYLGEKNRLEYEINIAPGMYGWIDKDKLEKIVFNLLSNAFKHCRRDDQVVLQALENGQTGEMEIRVLNSGSLSQEKLHQLFDKFYVADTAGSGRENFGTGIGLAFTRQLVDLLKGRIVAKSENDRISFTVFLPLFKEEPTNSDIEIIRHASDKPSYLYQTITSYAEPFQTSSDVENNKQAIIETLQEEHRKNILVVEDDRDIRYLIKDILKDDYIIYEASDGHKALELIEKVVPDLAISDVMMPGISGLELCNKLKNTPATCHVPIVILSARGSEDHHMEGYEVGADAYIAKPFHADHLKLRVRKMLESRQKLLDLFKKDGVSEILTASELPDGDKEFMAKLVRCIVEHINDHELCAVFLEKAFRLSKMQLYRKLKTLTGMTPGEFIKHIRLKEAATLLTSTNLTVTEIFYQTGFNNQSYFFREFKKRYNCAPNEYRENQKLPV
ncbi:MAG: hybrid sensor histidine kinase/response regulator transcription factor [Flavisolibacter sp.]